MHLIFLLSNFVDKKFSIRRPLWSKVPGPPFVYKIPGKRNVGGPGTEVYVSKVSLMVCPKLSLVAYSLTCDQTC